MFARRLDIRRRMSTLSLSKGPALLSSPPLLDRKPSSVKSRVCISSKLIESKGLQLQHFGHLRKTGGWGSYLLVHTTRHPLPPRSEKSRSCRLKSPACELGWGKIWEKSCLRALRRGSSPGLLKSGGARGRGLGQRKRFWGRFVWGWLRHGPLDGRERAGQNDSA